jgi:hypothetical protein
VSTVVQAFVVVAAMLPAIARALPTYDEVRDGWKSSEGLLLDRHGEVIHELRVDMHGRRLDWVKLEEVSPAFVQTVIRAEDKRFYKHSGVDWLALGDAALDNLFSSRTRGASTLSMQVAAMLEASLKRRHGHRTVGQKWDQIQAARDLETKWSKRQILETYLNLSAFRGEVQGVGAAARALFDKLPSGLDEKESLLLAVLLRGPNARRDGNQAPVQWPSPSTHRTAATAWRRWRRSAWPGHPTSGRRRRWPARCAQLIARSGAGDLHLDGSCRRSLERSSASLPSSMRRTWPTPQSWSRTMLLARCWPMSVTPVRGPPPASWTVFGRRARPGRR